MENLKKEIEQLKKERNAVLLAHYYVDDAVQEIADYVGDSYYLAKVALKESKEFDEYMIQMVVVGQSIGNLDVVFKELSTYYARQKELNYQIQDAITYPFVLILMMFVIVATLIFKVFPIFENILSQMSMSLSLMYSARILSYIGFFILLFILVFGLILYFIYKKIHCIGIGGIGLSAVAEILMARGYDISGSDMRESLRIYYLYLFQVDMH